MKNRLYGISLFSSAGIGETYLEDIGIDILVANELIEKRANLYQKIYPNAKVICGDITDLEVFHQIVDSSPKHIDFLLASPPCQGMSVAGKNRNEKTMSNDKRNYLILYVIDMIKIKNPDYILIENVPALLKLKIHYQNQMMGVLEILNYEFSNDYEIVGEIVDSADYGVPQTRLRAIIRMNKRGKIWKMPSKVSKKVSVAETIGHLPSLESGQSSDIQWHFARSHSPENILWMKHTPTGKSAFNNEIHFPKKSDGTRIKGYESSYRRIHWDKPAPTITIRNDCIASQRNVHPGRKKEDNTYSDARVLTPLELMLLNSLPENWNIPKDTPELLIRQCIGESIPPLMIKALVEGIINE
ncbi:DNA (cytosine-5-)-methyltransferase [Moraxella bovis]|uniref:DNA (cytosine-5-)-methyltransferase n=1 Tax=Moraxella bovis TaxID=476 RepID=UPI0022274FB7|nr:DNA (cytosine-5-)-methyltransferase [Moraxella bovis]UYZ67859.1 DNA (cytosine-5-)-methyltransferase [Moraxella bovis]UYZ70234.1 DNA (cytosine-5-)-methyltransferase [Moraxella bovis]UYZ73857.1 DNA (cytosine-5-)-methyltransferase [Moraxella bovis]UZA13532.1 DNA (cytosine-5-)-methyltransferase [Moraxella bovis]UZA28112.1 DNA (cytosine-5-)-methyltransferase [Moraxella bovis]